MAQVVPLLIYELRRMYEFSGGRALAGQLVYLNAPLDERKVNLGVSKGGGV